jgi:hypothetical protein
MKYKIYKLIHKGDVVYVGRTKSTLAKRKAWGYKGCGVESIAKHCSIELIEETDDLSKERYWIDFYGIDSLLNESKGDTGLTKEQYVSIYKEKNKDRLKEYRKRRYNLNKDKIISDYYSKKKPVESRTCECGSVFAATRTDKIYCSRKCKDRCKSREKCKKISGKI